MCGTGYRRVARLAGCWTETLAQWHSRDPVDQSGDSVMLIRRQRPDTPALAAVFLIATASASAAVGAGTDRAEYLGAAASCDVVICSYVNKIVMCHRLFRTCAYRPLPRSLHLQRHKSHGSNVIHPYGSSSERLASENHQQARSGSMIRGPLGKPPEMP
jgi:hypothetical protein